MRQNYLAFVLCNRTINFHLPNSHRSTDSLRQNYYKNSILDLLACIL